MLQSQKRFEFNPEFWEMRWGMKELNEGDTVMVPWRGVCMALLSQGELSWWGPLGHWHHHQGKQGQWSLRRVLYARRQ